ncbi:hypothetical protein LAZ67_2002925 [Cordylochernes scorpioides]|uniref:Transposase n=1 Tax=Cordylochernes scorpioides TaxID=51811 RepID=A0ABY6K438_9ARAC|nr:hypothetical protein LAZ67_2002925 [Cordylochernes scorpioides]
MAIVFWDCKGVFLVDYLSPNTTGNAARYCEVLTKLRTSIKRKHPGPWSRKVLLVHDNARPHAARTTQTLLENFKWEIFTHPTYSPELAPIDFHLFPALKLHLGGKHFANDDEVQAEANHLLRRQDTAWYNSGIKKLLQRYQKCSDRNDLGVRSVEAELVGIRSKGLLSASRYPWIETATHEACSWGGLYGLLPKPAPILRMEASGMSPVQADSAEVPRYHRLPRPKSRPDCGRQGTSNQVDHCLYRKMEQGRGEDSKEPMESDPDYESGENTTSPKMENTLGRTQEIAPSQEDATPPPAVSDVLGSLTRTLHQLSAVTELSRDVELPRYDGSYEAQSFFDNYDAQADLAQLQYTERLRRLPNLLQGKALHYFRSLKLDKLYYVDARQALIDLFPETTNASFARFLAIKLTLFVRGVLSKKDGVWSTAEPSPQNLLRIPD